MRVRVSAHLAVMCAAGAPRSNFPETHRSSTPKRKVELTAAFPPADVYGETTFLLVLGQEREAGELNILTRRINICSWR